MFDNYFKMALRNIKKSKGYSLLNIAGLAIGISCCLLIVLFVAEELSYDRFHPNAERIFRVVFSTSKDGKATNANGSFGVGPLLKKDFPQVVESVRLRKMGQGVKRLVAYKEKKFYEQRFFFTESSWFKVFHFPLLKGNPDTALNRPHTIVLTESTARKYFGSGEEAMGKTLEADPYNNGKNMLFQVTGIAADVPDNSHVHFDFLASYTSQTEDTKKLQGFVQHFTYVLLDKKSSANEIQPQLLAFLHRHWRPDPWYTLSLQPLLDIHLRSRLRSEVEATGNIFYIYIFMAIAAFVLIIACINFINLTTARSIKRAREVGLRKVAGAQRYQLIYQFLGESFVLTLISVLLAIILASAALPFINQLFNKSLSLASLPPFIAGPGILSVILIVGLLSGLYPAFSLSAFSPMATLKSEKGTSSTGARLRKGLVMFQFVLSIGVILATLTASQQLRFIHSRSPGYDMEQIMVIPLNNDIRANFEAVRNEWLKNPDIQNVATSAYVPTRGSMHLAVRFEGMAEDAPSTTWVIYGIDKEFVRTYGLNLLAGANVERPLSKAGSSDFILGNLAAREMGVKLPAEALGRGITFYEYRGRVAGVVNDINIYSYHRQPYPVIYMITPRKSHNYLSIRINTNNMSAVIRDIKNTWIRMVPGYPMEYFFLDQNFLSMHRSDQRFRDIILAFSLLAIFVAALGLVGLAAYLAEQKTKEIGIRKVLGATTIGIYLRTSWEFLKGICLANLIAWPLGYFFMKKWLQNFAYRTHIGPGLFLAASTIVLAIAVAAISYQSMRAAFANPVETLRYE